MGTNLIEATILPNLPDIQGIEDPLVRNYLEALKETVEVWRGQRLNGDPLDQIVTMRDLYKSGVVNVWNDDGEEISFEGDLDIPVISSAGGASGLGVPETPQNVTSSAGVASILLDWDAASYSGHAYVEIWRSASNNIGNAVKVLHVPVVAGQDPGAVVDPIGSTGVTRYYWIRFININNKVGNFHAGPTSGESATTGSVADGDITALDGSKIIAETIVGGKMVANTITATQIAATTITAAEIAATTITADKYSELRNSMIISQDDSLDGTYPFEIPFPISSEMTDINQILLSFSIEPFRAYATSASGGGGVVGSTVDAVGMHTHTLAYSIGSVSGYDRLYTKPSDGKFYYNAGSGSTRTLTFSTADGHNHTVSVFRQSTTTDLVALYADVNGNGIHNILENTYFTNESNSHTHTHTNGSGFGQFLYINSSNAIRAPSGTAGNWEVVGGPSSHSHTGGTHTHSVSFGIYEESNSPTINVYRDNGSGYGSSLGSYTTDQLELDLTAQFSGTGWKKLKFTTTARCRISAVLDLKLDITA